MKLNSRHRVPRKLHAFTLIELLVVAGIIVVLAAIALPVYGRLQKRGQLTRELHAARQLMVAYAAHAAANDGELLKGYDKRAQSVTLASGKSVSGEMCCRYPWRLAPFLGEQIEEVFLVNDSQRATETLDPGSFEYQYRASLQPAFGINAYCVGGYDDGSDSGAFGSDVVRRMAGASHAAKLIVFASARMKQNGAAAEVAGNFIVTPPRFWRTKWTTPFDRGKPAGSFGNVDPRWEGRAICAFLDGHVELLDEKQLLDMRHWSNTAADTNDPEFTVPR